MIIKCRVSTDVSPANSSKRSVRSSTWEIENRESQEKHNKHVNLKGEVGTVEVRRECSDRNKNKKNDNDGLKEISDNL